MTKKSCLFSFLFVFAIFGLMVSSFLYAFGKFINSTKDYKSETNKFEYISGTAESTNKILEIDINGVILDNSISDNTFFDLLMNQQVTYGYDVKKTLVDAASDSEIKAILLRINSPGGTITGSKAISDGIKKFQDMTGKKVYAHVTGMAASGAYWVASSTDYIGADFGSLTGSVGVIFGPFKEYDKVLAESTQFGDSVATESGINTFYITGGTDKDFGNPYKKMSDKTKQTLQEGIDNEYQNFVTHVSSHRNISEDTLKNQIGALIYENTQAMEYKLIDGVKSYDDYIFEILEKTGLSRDNYQVVGTKHSYTLLEELLMSSKATIIRQSIDADVLNGVINSKLVGRTLLLDPKLNYK